MSSALRPLDKAPTLDPSQDFYYLRREGIGFIQRAGSAHYTDYNLHDPGITILEALCYALTEHGYRLGWPIADLLAPKTPSSDPEQPYPDQPFFSARQILTINPVTTDDFRRLLIDRPAVRNAWVLCKECACEVSYWAFCGVNGQLVLQYGAPADPPNPAKEVWALGLQEVLLELEADPELGDLNDRLIAYEAVYHDSDDAHPLLMELRFPDISLVERDAWQLFVGADSDAAFADPDGFTISILRMAASKSTAPENAPTPFDVFKLPVEQQKRYLQEHWNELFYLSLRIKLVASGATIDIEDATLRVFAGNVIRNGFEVDDWKALFTDTQASGFIGRYRRKAKKRLDAMADAKTALRESRNLDQDYCLISGVGIEPVAVCADIEVEPDADIERVQAKIWFEIEQYFNPPIPFRTLPELQSAGTGVEDIFDGPALENGFIEDKSLHAAELRSMLRGSDIINRLMDIEGVLAVNQLRMTKYDAEGNVVAGASDPTWNNGQPSYDTSKTSAAWLLSIRPRHQPRLYRNQSRFLFYKSGLPFLPRMDEATDTLNQLRGDAERPKNPNAPKDLPSPRGIYRNPDDYYPVQYSFPLNYGIGEAGLPSDASPRRRAQAKDLKAYLMVFEQLLANSYAQLAHTSDLFSLDPSVARTYFAKAFDKTSIAGFDEIANSALEQAALDALIETPSEFLERRNAFLDHLLARFGEQFDEYALLLTNAAGEAVAQHRLIENKLAFLKRHPKVSHDRARAFNYAVAPCAPDNQPGIKKRVNLLLGYPDLTFAGTAGVPVAGKYAVSYALADGHGKPWLEGSVTVDADFFNLQVTVEPAKAAEQAAYRSLVGRMVIRAAYAIESVGTRFRLTLHDGSAVEVGHSSESFATRDGALALQDALLAWAASERTMVVEHLLLRPKFIGDALYPACCDGGCTTCGNEDPYSFRLTYVMPGWTDQYTGNLDLRRYAERTIQQQTPSHLVPKTCWVGNDGFIENPCEEVVDRLAALLIAQGRTADNTPPAAEEACTCAKSIYHAFAAVFDTWYADKKLTFLQRDALLAAITTLFQGVPVFADGTCTTAFDAALWDEVRKLMTAHFVAVALHGFQFERFEWAYCQWLEANAAIDWTEERLVERVEAILAANVQTRPASPAALCDCAGQIVTDYGTHFFAWMRGVIAAGKTSDDASDFAPPAVTLCPNATFAQGTRESVEALLATRYAAYVKPSYWLWAVVTLLANLRNTYPGATLHDCDDGSDQNPVRLDSTALGNYPRRTTL